MAAVVGAQQDSAADSPDAAAVAAVVGAQQDSAADSPEEVVVAVAVAAAGSAGWAARPEVADSGRA